MRIPNSIIRWTNTDIKIEADPRHVERLIKEMGLGGAIPVVTPEAKEREGRSAQADQPLDRAEASAYRACVARELSSTI